MARGEGSKGIRTGRRPLGAADLAAVIGEPAALAFVERILAGLGAVLADPSEERRPFAGIGQLHANHLRGRDGGGGSILLRFQASPEVRSALREGHPPADPVIRAVLELLAPPDVLLDLGPAGVFVCRPIADQLVQAARRALPDLEVPSGLALHWFAPEGLADARGRPVVRA